MPKCPVCDAPVNLETGASVPFCSDRCRLIDLGRWLDESYAVPEPKKQDEADDEADA